MDFLHCNGCGHVPCHSDFRRYFLTSCAHVFCVDCSRRIQDVCGVCQATCRLVEVCSDSKGEIKAYFMDPLEILKDSMRRLTQVAQFQRTQQKMFNVQVGKLMEAQKTLKSEQESLKAENSMLKKKVEALQQHEQNWIGNGSLQSPRGIGSGGFFAQSAQANPSLNSIFESNATSARRQESSGHSQSHPLFSSHVHTPPGHRYAPGRLTMPHTPQRREQLGLGLYSPGGFDSNSATPTSSTGRFSTPPLSSTTPDIVSRLQQLRCRVNTPTRAPSGPTTYPTLKR